MEKELKERMDDLRQVKDVVYENEKGNTCAFSVKQIEDLVKNYPNDYDLGGKLRKLYLESIK